MTPEADALAAVPDFEAFRRDRGWPTPNHMRSAADAIDVFTPAQYGSVLRWFADLSDAALTESGYSLVPTARLTAAEAAMRADSHRPRAERIDGDTPCKCCLWLDAYREAPDVPVG